MRQSIHETVNDVKNLFKDDMDSMLIGTVANLSVFKESIMRVYQKEDGTIDWEFETRESLGDGRDDRKI